LPLTTTSIRVPLPMLDIADSPTSSALSLSMTEPSFLLSIWECFLLARPR
jgi:hypothetical protein